MIFFNNIFQKHFQIYFYSHAHVHTSSVPKDISPNDISKYIHFCLHATMVICPEGYISHKYFQIYFSSHAAAKPPYNF